MACFHPFLCIGFIRIFVAVAAVKVNIEEFLGMESSVPVLDVRSPGEYKHAHIPGAFSFPIFDNGERSLIGTAYKQQSREAAIKIGVEAFGKKMPGFIDAAQKILNETQGGGKELRVHCWRGGMRSGAMAWLLDLYGFKVYLLNGGYKAYRQFILSQFSRPVPLFIIGGCTGGNKTGIVHELKKINEPVIDLEGIAGHMGSAFGNLDQLEQPGQEQFENLLGMAISDYRNKATGPIWLEGESQRIGSVNIPMDFFRQMRSAVVFFMDIPFEVRLAHIVTVYGKYSTEKLVNATLRIQKRLGGLETKTAIAALEKKDVETAFAIFLKYYDKLYLKSTLNTDEGEREIIYIKSDVTDATYNTNLILEHVRQYNTGRTH